MLILSRIKDSFRLVYEKPLDFAQGIKAVMAEP